MVDIVDEVWGSPTIWQVQRGRKKPCPRKPPSGFDVSSGQSCSSVPGQRATRRGQGELRAARVVSFGELIKTCNPSNKLIRRRRKKPPLQVTLAAGRGEGEARQVMIDVFDVLWGSAKISQVQTETQETMPSQATFTAGRTEGEAGFDVSSGQSCSSVPGQRATRRGQGELRAARVVSFGELIKTSTPSNKLIRRRRKKPPLQVTLAAGRGEGEARQVMIDVFDVLWGSAKISQVQTETQETMPSQATFTAGRTEGEAGFDVSSGQSCSAVPGQRATRRGQGAQSFPGVHVACFVSGCLQKLFKAFDSLFFCGVASKQMFS